MKCSDGMISSAGGSPYITHHLLSIQTNYVMRHSRRIYTATIPSVRRISEAYLQLLPPWHYCHSSSQQLPKMPEIMLYILLAVVVVHAVHG